MLTKQECVFEARGREVFADRLTRGRHAHYIPLSEEMLRIYSEGVGKTRAELHAEIASLFHGESHCPQKRIAAFCKLLDDAGRWQDKRSGKIADLRMRVFELSAPHFPVVQERKNLLSSNSERIRNMISGEMEISWPEIEASLFSDVFELQKLEEFRGYESAAALLARYNEAQIQALLYSALELQVTTREDYRAIISAAKRALLLHDPKRLADGSFEFLFYGPLSALRDTRRYGVNLARLIPTLLSCGDWSLRAPVKVFKKGRPLTFRLSSDDKLTGSGKSLPEFDSTTEEKFHSDWGTEPREGWTIKREAEPLFRNQKVFFPDFSFVHKNGKTVHLEIIGFWTPQYLEEKQKTLRLFRKEPIVLAISGAGTKQQWDTETPSIEFKKSLKPESVLDLLRPLR